ncbi:TIGR03086 family metal-binding protein [Streptomyces synnematoformans]|uniref:TIGR03086 family metal-binding protein n=1 Tax=Streptomyces synnematoformans TaxID=415721 RepID=A0ABN2A1D2_9ACTN
MSSENSTNADVYAVMKECAEEAARIARGVRPEQLDGPTPCADWDVRTLVNHWVAFTSHGLEHRALRTPLPEELPKRDFAAEPGWADAYAAQLDRAVAAWAAPAVWEGDVDLGFLSMAAPEVAAVIAKEMAVHGWDVARATGQEYRASAGVAALVLRVAEDHGEMYRKYDGFAEAVSVPADAPPFDRALAATGRDPQFGAG